MFEICAVLGARSERLRRYGHLLGILYHGCDDVADQRGVEALGGGGEEDVRDGILTLPAALAIRDEQTRRLFVKDDDDSERLAFLTDAFKAQLDAAEAVLDGIASEARAEAAIAAEDALPLLALVEEVRGLSSR
jgi:geranylgeranyl pyrophosphate synthase